MADYRVHHWSVRLEIREDEDHCEVVAHLDAGDRSLTGVGRSRRNPADPKIPQIGEEMATARALHDLAQHLGQDAWRMIEEFDPAHGFA
ncbi:MAG: dsRBD fold-containing protein [Ilumatobacteraceae bacterium]|nr:MAG: DUF1876 domain-containing protein [Actinomycetota bacterium]